MRRLDRALRAHADWHAHGKALPESGGTREQPALWHFGVGAVEGAYAQHAREIRERPQGEE